jgi:hypothetical protein
MIEDEHQPYDKSSKWLIQHHGGSILRLAGVQNVAAWRPVQAEVVQPSQMPDGLLEVRLEGEAHDDLFLLEVATYPERRVEDQLTRDLMLVYLAGLPGWSTWLVYLDRGELPEAVTLVLRPKGKGTGFGMWLPLPDWERLRPTCLLWPKLGATFAQSKIR